MSSLKTLLVKPNATREREVLELPRMILGLLHLGLGTEQIMVLLGERFEELVRDVLSSGHATIRRLRENGLRHSVSLPAGVFVACPTCKHRINYVPCVVCSRHDRHGDGEQEYQDEPLREPAFTTQAEPGSLLKVNVMRERFARGEMCFHEEDER